MEIISTADESSFLDDQISEILSDDVPQLPPFDQKVGHVEVHWDAVDGRRAWLSAYGGTPEDRILARRIVEAQLASAGFTVGSRDWGMEKSANWDDIMAKAKRLLSSGNVQVLRNGYNNIVARVRGDGSDNDGQPDTHQCEIFRDDPNSRAITGSDCDCGWGEFQNQPRTRQWKRFQDRPCVLENATIAMADGTYKSITEVQVGETVWTHDGIGTVIELMERDYDGDMLELASYGYGTPLILTPEHEVWAYGTPQRFRRPWQEASGQGFQFYNDSFLFDADPEWIDPSDLKVHDWLTSPIHDATDGRPLDFLSLIPEDWNFLEEDGRVYRSYTKETQRRGQDSYKSVQKYKGSVPRFITPNAALMKVLGLYVAEGNVIEVNGFPGQIQWTFNLNERETLVRELEGAVKELGCTLSIYERTEVNAISCRLTNHSLAMLVTILAGHHSQSKQWHPWIMHLSPSDQQILLDWHREGDGSERPDGRWRIDTSSYQLALQTRDMLLRCGNLPTWSLRKQRGGPTNRDKICTIYRVSWVADPQISTSGQRSDPHRSFVSTKIRDIKRRHHQGKVYNLAVYPQQSYVADGRIVHNCSHILAAFWQAQSMPLDEDINPQNPQGQGKYPSQGTFGPEADQGFDPAQRSFGPDDSSGFSAPGPSSGGPGGVPPAAGPPGGSQEPMGPSPADVLPQYPMAQMPQPQPQNLVSIPGANPPTPANPVQYPSGPGGTFSSVLVPSIDTWDNPWSSWHFADADEEVPLPSTGQEQDVTPPNGDIPQKYTNGDIVQLRYPDTGVLQGRSEEHGAGQDFDLQPGLLGEVLGTDPTTGMVTVLYSGKPWEKNKELEPWGAMATHWPSYLIPRPDVKRPGPAVRRRR